MVEEVGVLHTMSTSQHPPLSLRSSFVRLPLRSSTSLRKRKTVRHHHYAPPSDNAGPLHLRRFLDRANLRTRQRPATAAESRSRRASMGKATLAPSSARRREATPASGGAPREGGSPRRRLPRRRNNRRQKRRPRIRKRAGREWARRQRTRQQRRRRR